MSGNMDCFVCGEVLKGDFTWVGTHINRCLDRQGSSAGPRLKADTSSSSLSSSSKSARPLSPLSPGAQKFTHDAQLALRLAQELNVTPALPGVGFSSAAAAQEAREKRDHQLALALAWHTESEANSRAAYEGWRDGGGGEGARDRKTSLAATVRTTASEAESCPCCEARWTDLGQALSGVSLSGSTKSEQEWQLVEVRRKNHVQKCVEEKANLAAQLGDEGETWDGDECGDGAGTQGVVQQGDVTWTGGRKGKDAVVGTPGLIYILKSQLLKSHSSSHGRTSQAYLVSPETEHIATRVMDFGWGCGYKNAQMLLSAARHLPSYSSILAAPSPASSSSTTASNVSPIPTIRELQVLIEEAWKAGHDAPGRQHFNGHLVGSRRWIGTTEVYTALTWMGLRAKIVDFAKTPGGDGTHQSLLRWITNYFSPSPSSSNPSASAASSSQPRNAFTLLTSSSGTAIHLTPKQPLYLQHRGHSRTIVGIEMGKSASSSTSGGSGGVGGARGGLKGKVKAKLGRGADEKEDEMWLLLFDPARPIPASLARTAASLIPPPSTSLPVASSSSSSASQPPLKRLKSTSPDLERRGGFGGGGFGKSKEKDDGDLKFGDVLKCFRVNMNELKKRNEYQILFIESGPPLSAAEKKRRRVVNATVISPGYGGGGRGLEGGTKLA